MFNKIKLQTVIYKSYSLQTK